MAAAKSHPQKITPHLWYDTEALEAAEFYVSVFADATIVDTTTLHDTPSPPAGDTEIVTIELYGQEFMMISAGPIFKLNPSVSFLVTCDSPEEVDDLWGKLSQGGTALMELGSYPFSDRYGWLNDKYGLSWQLMYSGERSEPQKIIPSLMFVGDVSGKAEEALGFYAEVFPHAQVGPILRYGGDEAPEVEGTVKYSRITLEGVQFAAMDSAREHEFAFNPAVSFIVHCEDQDEIDYYWGKLSAVPEAEQCGWLADRFGLSWQIVPSRMEEMLREGTEVQIARVTQAFLPMKKLIIAELEEAFAG